MISLQSVGVSNKFSPHLFSYWQLLVFCYYVICKEAEFEYLKLERNSQVFKDFMQVYKTTPCFRIPKLQIHSKWRSSSKEANSVTMKLAPEQQFDENIRYIHNTNSNNECDEITNKSRPISFASSVHLGSLNF